MTVKELRNELENYDDDMKVVCKNENGGGYVDCVSDLYTKAVRTFFGDDYRAVVLAGGQVGMI